MKCNNKNSTLSFGIKTQGWINKIDFVKGSVNALLIQIVTVWLLLHPLGVITKKMAPYSEQSRDFFL